MNNVTLACEDVQSQAPKLYFLDLTCGKLFILFTKMGSKICSAKHLRRCRSGIC